MAPDRLPRPIRVRAHAKLNLTLRVLGTRADGYHELRTTFQSLALHDTLTIVPTSGPFEIDCDDPACPGDRTNLVWKAAEGLWRSLGQRGRPSGYRIRIAKRIPIQAGLGGGSSDAAAALRALAVAWRARHTEDDLRAVGRELGADVPFFLAGGTGLGLERGDLLFTLPDCRPSWVVLVVPPFGVSARDAYRWWDAAAESGAVRTRRLKSDGAIAVLPVPSSEMVNDLEAPVVARHPQVGRLVERFLRVGASHAAMSGSGSAVFGVFGTEHEAVAAASLLRRPDLRVLVTRTLGRAAYQRLSRPRAHRGAH